MPDTVIRVENLSKKYTLHHLRPGGQGLRHVLQDTVSGPWRAITNWAKQKTAGNGEVSEPMSASTLPTDEDFWALKDVSFDIKRGEVLGIIGRNGSGKSTLLKILSRITEPTTGRIEIEGRVASLLEVGTGFHPELTGRENIFLNGAILGMSRAEIRNRFDEIVAFSEVERFLDTPVKRYSSGMHVRLAFSVAAHLNPEILIVDEVLAVGDASFQKKCIGKMENVAANEGRTVLFVSHNLSTVSTLCRKAMLLNCGSVLFSGNPQDAIARYSELSSSPLQALVDFTDRTLERFGKQEHAVWKSLQLLDANGQPSTSLQMGKKASFELCLEVKQPSRDFEIGVAITNLQNVALHYLVSGWEGFSAIPESGRHTLRVDVPSVHLFPGDYQVNVWIAVRGAYYDDAVHEALRFRVEEGTVNGHDTYFGRFSKNTQVYIPSLWTCTKNPG